MIEIKDLLLRFNKIILNERFKKDLIIETINTISKINIKSEDVILKKNNIYLNTKPIYKNQIFLNKNQILSILEEKLGKRIFTDII